LLAARLWLAYYYEYDRQIAPARAIYEALANLPAAELPPSDPVRQLVYLRLASMAANDGVKEEAQRLFAKTGLSAQQCAIADVRALPINRSVSGRDFPAEAARWAMDGYVRVAFDVDAGGKPKGVRAVLSYPPFIFNSATERAVGSFRYAPVFRDGATEGCVGQSQAVRFKTPR
jgi:outer membrane biosynthesis protein TonB